MKLFTSLLILSLIPSWVWAKAILGVDMGSLYMKVALVQRGAPLEIVTNLHSKRKTENMVLFDADSRFYGADANSLYGRKPTKTPSALSILLGRDEQHPSVAVLEERHYPILPKYNETRFGVSLNVDGNDFTPEELVAMVLSHARDMTIAYGKENSGTTLSPKDLVLTVPSFATQHERRALLDAAALADLNVLSLVDETTAAALHYGMDKIMEEPKILIFYNLGASSLQVSVVRFLSYQHKDSKYAKAKTVGGLEVLGKAWDTTFGGLALDHRIVEYLADEFNAQWKGGDVRKFPRAMAKLRVQANKVKHVLSANTEMPVFMEALHDDTPLSVKITREKLEELCADLLERATKPIELALQRANVTLDQVDEIELIGGGMRVPKVQEYLKKYLGEAMELGMHINSDESMALGASFHGANISTAFKVRHVGMADINPFPIKISLTDLEGVSNGADDEPWSKEATIFKSGGKVGVKKTIAFTHDTNVHCGLDYDDSETLPEGTETPLERYKITGVSDFAAEMKEKGLGAPKVSLQFELSNSGITRLVKAEAAVEEVYTVMEDEEVDDDEEEEETEGDDSKDAETKAAGSAESNDDSESKKDDSKEEESSDKDDSPKEEEEPKKKKKKVIQVEKEKKKVHRRSLTVENYYEGRVQPYSSEIMEESKAKMDELARKDKERQLLEETRNKVESYIYKIKNKLVDDEENIEKVTTEAQREEVSKLSSDAEEWLYEDGYTADLATMEDKYAEISEPMEKILFRLSEMTARPAAIVALNEKLDKIEKLMTKWETTHSHITQEERGGVLEKVEEVKKWIAEKEEEQSKLAGSDDPVFTSEECPGQTKSIESMVSRLSRKPKPKPVVEETSDSDSGSNETQSEEDSKSDEEEPLSEESKEEGSEKPAEESTGDEAKDETTSDEL
mmetsp:Transcript_4232/g.6592  ORF Transcript_4232/g.6592 Transcript_4232/m.6592 type:complete len:913 (+) Transcript_4232:132-2870(+)|eukprot:CAMPEP_0178933768 /NCGR_PEP_ID=MMETSP0786-20121207/23469_1 /TAXON_ID=186022 /ORGANISM="Thalassionema frauenfeldii, Strain CCMP 1798" /LENGTH=912 /DNA_ID=CAMNT_0020611433 /DNA_START=91 /DNA_END=2829 /DNA_ORIENTATION=-